MKMQNAENPYCQMSSLSHECLFKRCWQLRTFYSFFCSKLLLFFFFFFENVLSRSRFLCISLPCFLIKMEPLVLEEELGGAAVQVTEEGALQHHPGLFITFPPWPIRASSGNRAPWPPPPPSTPAHPFEPVSNYGSHPERTQMLSSAPALLQRTCSSLCCLSIRAADGSRKAH